MEYYRVVWVINERLFGLVGDVPLQSQHVDYGCDSEYNQEFKDGAAPPSTVERQVLAVEGRKLCHAQMFYYVNNSPVYQTTDI